MGTEQRKIWQGEKKLTRENWPFFPIKYHLRSQFPEWMGGQPVYMSVWENDFIQDDLELYAYLYDQMQTAKYRNLPQHIERTTSMLAQVRKRLVLKGEMRGD